MEKYGVACGCAQGKPDMENMTKLADGSKKCPQCGAEFKALKLKDEVELKDKGLRKESE